MASTDFFRSKLVDAEPELPCTQFLSDAAFPSDWVENDRVSYGAEGQALPCSTYRTASENGLTTSSPERATRDYGGLVPTVQELISSDENKSGGHVEAEKTACCPPQKHPTETLCY
ncbi:hypothetical protein IF2G_11109 [Cordyceps javanica]|nr:hypothetical protein IF2G_11109 [Cordyceps javanica]